VRDLENLLKRCVRSKTLMLVAVVLLTEFLYFAVISVGKFDWKWPIQMLFYDQLADGFRSGHLYIPNGPNPLLIAQKNPYDPINMRLWNLDATYYQGRYYIYWGPFPALIQWFGKSLLDIRRTIGDQYLVFLFFGLMTVFGALLIRRMAQRLATGVPPWLVAVGTLGLGLANPVTYLLASAGVYQAAISGAQAFLFLGILFAFDAVWEPAHGPRRVLWLVLAGIAWSMSIGCRISVILAIAPIILCTIICTCVTEETRLRRFVRDGFWVSTPIALTIFVLLYYNKVRFDEWFNFGVSYMLSAYPFRSASSYILPNIESYLLRAPIVDCNFPYVFATSEHGAGPISSVDGLPTGYLVREPVIGMLYVVPLCYLAPIAIIAGARRIRRGLFESASSIFAAESRQRRTFVWFVLCMLLAAVGPAVIPVSIFFATMRYLSDFTNAVIILAILGLFVWYGRPTSSKWYRRVRACTTLAMVGVTIGCGLLLGYQGYMPYFKMHNPELHNKIAPALSLCSRD
jgi:hypothetical protein